MAAQWPQQYPQPLTAIYGSGPYQQPYPQQQAQPIHPQYAYGQQQAGQAYAQQAYSQPPHVQQQYAQQTPSHQAQYQQPTASSGAAPQQPQQAYVPPQQPSQVHQYGPGQQQQQHAYQTHGTPMQVATAAHPAQPPQPAQPSHNCCFNCGSANHWAQSCPEPKKEPQTSAPSNKRQKFTAPVVTKYPVPPHVAQAQALQQQAAQQAWGPQGYGQYGYPQQYPMQQQAPYPPPTPMSAQTPPNGQWPQNAQYPQNQQAPQPGYAGQYPQYSYTPTPQTPAQYYGPQPPSQSSPAGHQGSPVKMQQTQVTQPQVTQAPSYPSVTPQLAQSSPMTQYPQYPYSQGNATANVYPSLPPSNPATHSQSAISLQQPAPAVPEEPEEDDLRKLNVPDMPSTEGGSTATLVGRPLPTNFVVADALAPFAPPALGDNGLCRSKYLERPDSNHEVQNVKETSDWNTHKKDPMFASLADDGKLVSFRELDAIYRPHQLEREPSPVLYSRCESGYEEPHRANNGHNKDVMDSLEHALRGRKHQSPPDRGYKLRSTKRTRSLSREDDLYGQEPEDARRGSKGDSIRAKPPPRPYPPPTPKEQNDDSGHEFRSRSASPRRQDFTSRPYISPPDSGFNGQTYKGHSNQYRRDSRYSQDHSRRRDDQTFPEQFDRPPPPPPPPLRNPSWYDGPGASPSSVGLAQRNPFEPDEEDSKQFGDTSLQNGHTADATVASSLKLRSERSYVRRKESSRDDSSDEQETPGRRQADDVTPKLKRRQPKVAAAYSRRW